MQGTVRKWCERRCFACTLNVQYVINCIVCIYVKVRVIYDTIITHSGQSRWMASYFQVFVNNFNSSIIYLKRFGVEQLLMSSLIVFHSLRPAVRRLTFKQPPSLPPTYRPKLPRRFYGFWNILKYTLKLVYSAVISLRDNCIWNKQPAYLSSNCSSPPYIYCTRWQKYCTLCVFDLLTNIIIIFILIEVEMSHTDTLYSNVMHK